MVYTPFPTQSAGHRCADRAEPARHGRRRVGASAAGSVVGPALPIYRARTLPQVRRDLDWNGRVSNGLFLFLAFIAVALATFGCMR